jgi:replicative DNA helicase
VNLRHRVVLFSLEMSKESLLQRMAVARARVDSQKFRHGTLDRDERSRLSEAMQVLIESPLLIDDSSGPTFTEIRSKVSRIIRRYGPVGLVGVDYLQLMTSKGKTENRQQEVSGFSRTAKLTAKALNLPIIVLSQLSRACEQRKGDHRPMLSDLRESGSIEQDSDVVGLLYRGEVYDKRKIELKGKAEMDIAKQRSGPTGVAKLSWIPTHGRFENALEEHLYPDAED